MTGRILRTELRRSAALWTAPVVALLGAATLYALPDRWVGRWIQLAMWQRQYLFLLVPLVLGAGAWQARRDRKARMGELLATTPRPGWHRATVEAGAMAVAAALAYAGMFAAGAGQVAPTATYFSTAWIPVVAVGALALVAAMLLGLAAGRLLPGRLAPPLVAVAGLLAILLPAVLVGNGGASYDLLQPIVSTANQSDFVTFTTRLHLLQTLWFAGLAATGLLVFAASRPVVRLLGVLPAALAVAVVVPMLPTRPEAALVADRGSYALVCTSDRPTVCVTKLHAHALTDLRGPGRRALSILAAKLPDAPTRVVEAHTEWFDPGREKQAPDTVLVALLIGRSGQVDDPADLLQQSLDGAGTRECPNDFSDIERLTRDRAARLTASAWLQDQPPGAGEEHVLAEATKAYETLRGFPAGEQRDRVSALRRAALACDGRDLLDVLIGKAGRS
jgi:hypothetical protein